MTIPDFPPIASREHTTARRLQLDVEVTRSGLVESRHRVHAAVVDAHGQLLASAGDPTLRTWWRSCAKPFQVMALVRDGGLAPLGWSVDELALACASHGGEPEHVALAESMLQAIGLDESHLACGPHEPLAERGARMLRDAGGRWTRVHNNCSGKHTAMLARAQQLGVATAGYHVATHPVQEEGRRMVAAWAGIREETLAVGTDGCGVSVFALPLENMALAYARLAWSATAGDMAAARIVSAMTTRPFLVGGTERFDTVLMEACGGRVLCKIGAEGVHTLALVERGIGIAVKVEDGAARAQYPAVLAVLRALDVFDDVLPPSLQPWWDRPVRNTRQEQVGVIGLPMVATQATEPS